jgi:hypothetical protein
MAATAALDLLRLYGIVGAYVLRGLIHGSTAGEKEERCTS